MVRLERIMVEVNGLEVVLDVDDANSLFNIIAHVFGIHGMKSTVTMSEEGGYKIAWIPKDEPKGVVSPVAGSEEEEDSGYEQDQDWRHGARFESSGKRE